jgi:hypothetical protein
MCCGRAGFKTSKVVIDGTHNDQLMVRPDTLAAEDTFAQISDDKRIGLLQGFVIGHMVEIGFADAHLGRHLP